MINKNTVIAKTIDVLNEENKEIDGYITGVVYSDNKISILVDGNNIKIICMYLALTQILADKYNMNVKDFFLKANTVMSESENFKQ